MKTRLQIGAGWLFAAGLLMASVTGGALFAQGFNVRTGSWQFNMTLGGDLPIEGLPPAMRAELEAEMRKPQTYTSCITAEDIKALKLGKKAGEDEDDCKTLSSKMTATTADITRQCTGSEPRTEVVHFEAANPQSLRADISSKSSAGTTTITMTGKWTAAQCRD
jgi:hypothetical protein